MRATLKVPAGFAAYLVLAVVHALLAQPRHLEGYYGRRFDGSAVMAVLYYLALSGFALGYTLYTRQLRGISFARLLDVPLALASLCEAAAQVCLLQLGFEVSFLFQLVAEPATVISRTVQNALIEKAPVKSREVALACCYLASLSLFIVVKRGPFDYSVYALLLFWALCSGLARHFQRRTAIYPGQTKAADLLFGGLWGALFSALILGWKCELRRAPAVAALADCLLVALAQAGAAAVLLFFFDKAAGARVTALVSLSRLARLVSTLALFRRSVGFWEQFSVFITVGAISTEVLAVLLRAQSVEVFDHKKQREFEQTDYPRAAPSYSAATLGGSAGEPTQRLTQSSTAPRKSFHRQ